MRYFLTNVSIEGFRGINNESEPLKLQFKETTVNSVFAENGFGKSSIFDALSFVFRNEIPRLTELPEAERADDYYCNRFHKGGTASIVITLKPDDKSPDVTIRVKRDVKGNRIVDSPSGHPNPETLLKELDHPFLLLDQRTFLKFVEDSPLKRGRTFSGLLGLAALSEFRQVLEVLSNTRTIRAELQMEALNSEASSLRDRMRQLNDEMQDAFKKITSRDAGTISNESLTKEAADTLISIDLVKPFFIDRELSAVDFVALRKAIKDAEMGDKRERLGIAIKGAETLKVLGADPGEDGERNSLLEKILERDRALQETSGPLMEALYKSTVGVLESIHWKENICPVCEKTFEGSLLGLVKERLDQFSRVAAANDEISRIVSRAKWFTRLKRLEEYFELKEKEKYSGTVSENVRRGAFLKADLTGALESLDVLETKRVKRYQELESEKSAIEKVLPPSLVTVTEQVEAIEKIKNLGTTLSKLKVDLALCVQKLERRKQWQDFIVKAAKAFASAEVELSSKLITNIEGEYQRVYKEITRNPEVIPTLERSSGSQELHLKLSNFYGLKDVSATTLLPESYRNALAFAIFFSTGTSIASKSRFIILDDVTSSFDAGHQFALMELIRLQIACPSKLDGPQIILLSHDGLLNKYFDKTASDHANWYHQRLQGLPPKGAVLAQSQSPERLRVKASGLLTQGDAQLAEPLIRQYLEFRLFEVIRRVGIPVPVDFAIRDDRKMVDHALTAIDTAINLQRKAGTLILTQQQQVDIQSIHVPALVGNWVSHYATGSMSSFSPMMLVSVLDAIDKFVDCFKYNCVCPNRNGRVYYQSLEKKGCNCP